MVTRGVYFAAGAAVGVYGMVKARRVAEAFTADGMRDRANAASLGARMFRAEFHQGMVDAEHDLRERYEVAAARHHELASGSPRAIERTENRTGSERGNN